MTDKAWKPKRAGSVGSDSSSKEALVDISVNNEDCKSALTKCLKDIEGIRFRESQSAEMANLVIMDLAENPEETFTVIRDMGKMANAPEIFLTAPMPDSAVLLEAMRSGAKEFLAQPIQEPEVQRAIARYWERATTQKDKSQGEKKAGSLMALFGGKGGVGTTSIAVNLAAALRQLPSNPSVILVDVNQHGGDLPLYLDLQPDHSFRDIAADLSRLDPAFLLRVLTKCESGLQVLPSGYDDLSTGRLSPDCVEATLKLLQASFDYVVIDCGHVLDLTTKKALELATWIMVTSSLMVPVVHRTKRILELLRGSGFSASKIRLVINRYVSAEQDVLKETEDILKQKTFWCIPNDYPSSSQSVNSGKSIIEGAPRSSIAKSFKDFAATFEEQPATASKKSGVSSWLNPFKGRRAQSSPSGA
ncbi:MAG: AAA family ATPase [Nitrospirota bacterium]|nr:AAA family ATPase [Nitrospirota bacterium]MDX2420148.1 AAA family ATPase [Nitrospirota bacterium]